MAQPIRILWAPFTVYIATDLDAAFPDIDEVPDTDDWFKFGENGDRNYDDEGVTLNTERSIEEFRGAGETAIQKASATEENAALSFNLADFSLDQLSKVYDGNAVMTVAQSLGVAGNKKVEIYRGPEVKMFKLLARGIGASPELHGGNAQIEFAQVFQAGNPSPVFSKGAPALMACEFRACRAEDGGFVTIRAQTTVAGS